MMEKAYILENGILERYVLGELNVDEQQQVELAVRQHDELREFLEGIEYSFENLAIENGIEVPSTVKNELMRKISKPEGKIIPFVNTNSNTSYIWIAASIVALMSIGAIYLFSELNALKEDFKMVSDTNENLNNQVEALKASLDETNKWYEIVNNPETDKYVLKGNSLMANAIVVSYVNDVEKSVVINTKDLPELDDKHDYQMWADVEGVMIDMGVIDKNKNMMTMTYIDNAESLNITIEEKGGSDHPNVANLVTNIFLN